MQYDYLGKNITRTLLMLYLEPQNYPSRIKELQWDQNPNVHSNTRTPPRPTIGSINIEDVSNNALTCAITDLIITHNNEHPPRGFYRISKTSIGHDADLTALVGNISIYLNVKKEVH